METFIDYGPVLREKCSFSPILLSLRLMNKLKQFLETRTYITNPPADKLLGSCVGLINGQDWRLM
ncbi:hypothetical protein M501DRAFT_1001072 [Patellaria atrata CBS 101060]|uniref:Uncharacterized protein n=1 Tax=Patellaria atrata CBS 101060 TaxID=1346257 RepID=A0A9P4S376_9PEZI|nr:hypothetical protein M501DRAFT_1001072 [Patellaria atrata CBS 101060]